MLRQKTLPPLHTTHIHPFDTEYCQMPPDELFEWAHLCFCHKVLVNWWKKLQLVCVRQQINCGGMELLMYVVLAGEVKALTRLNAKNKDVLKKAAIVATLFFFREGDDGT